MLIPTSCRDATQVRYLVGFSARSRVAGPPQWRPPQELCSRTRPSRDHSATTWKPFETGVDAHTHTHTHPHTRTHTHTHSHTDGRTLNPRPKLRTPKPLFRRVTPRRPKPKPKLPGSGRRHLFGRGGGGVLGKYSGVGPGGLLGCRACRGFRVSCCEVV